MKKLLIVLALLLSCLCYDVRAGEFKDQAVDFAQSEWAAAIIKRGVLRVGFDTFVPWAMKDKTGKYIGFEIEIAEQLARDMGVKVQFVPTAWNGIIPALLAGKFDVLIGGMTITPERAEKVRFTEPYEFSGQSIVASKQVAPGLSQVEDFNKKDVNIVVRMGTTAEVAARELLPEAAILPFGDEGQAIQELRNGKAHAFVSSAPLPAQLAVRHPEALYLPVSGIITREPIGMALAPKNSDGLAPLNTWIASRHASKWLEERWQYWFESMEWEKELR